MTVPAFRAFLPPVLIVFLMAGVAIHRRVFEAIVCMAVFARHLHVLVAKLVAGLVVVEADLLPIPLDMAIGAGAPDLPFVFVVLLVAAVTIGRRVAIFGLGFVARLALDLLRIGMGAAKGEIGLRMVEGLFVDRGDIFGAPLMFRVAFLALALFLESPMKPLPPIDVLADVFVTIEAEHRLRRFVEPFVACGARLFPFSMSLDHLAWHKRSLDAVGPGGPAQKRPDSEGETCKVAGVGGH